MKKELLKKIVAVGMSLVLGFGVGYYGFQDEFYQKGYDTGYAEASVVAGQKYNDGYSAGYEQGYEDADLSHIWDDLKANGVSDPQRSSYGEILESEITATSITVYITNTGSKYHRSWCGYLHSSSTAVDLSWATSHGYSACSRCW